MTRTQTAPLASLAPLAPLAPLASLPRLVLAAAAAMTAAAPLAAGCAPTDTAEDLSSLDQEARAQLDDLGVRIQALEDREAIRGVAECYGRGHDEIFHHLQGDQSASLAVLRTCFTDDVHSDVYFFSEAAPYAKLSSLAELVGFIEQFAVTTKYTGARNVVGDLGIELTGPDTAVMVSATSTPHFIQAAAPGAQPTVDVVSARYRDELVRGADGAWRTRKKTLIIDQIWRGTGTYPFAM